MAEIARIPGFQPAALVVDPITSLVASAQAGEVRAALVRLVDLLKSSNINTVFTNVTNGGDARERSEVGISSPGFWFATWKATGSETAACL